MDEKQPMNGPERRAISHLMAFFAMSGGHGDSLKGRLGGVKNGWRDWRLMISLAAKLYSALLATLPKRQLYQMLQLESQGECRITMKSATHSADYHMVDTHSLEVIVKRAIRSECEICVMDDRAVKGCKLRKALIDVAPPEEIPRFGCPYRDAGFGGDWEDD